MADFLQWLTNNPVVIVLASIIIFAIVLMYLIAFLQGREVSFWPPKIGSKEESPLKQKDKSPPWKDSTQESSASHSTKPNAHAASPNCEITILAAERSHLSQYYLEQASSATTIDIIALTLQSALENFGEVKFIQWIQAGKNIRILMLSPYSDAAKIRSREESSNEDFLPAKIREQVKALKRLHTRAEKELKSQDYKGSLEVRIYDDLPYFSYFHTDNVMVMGLYYGHLRGLQSEALLIDEKSSIHAKMHDHFNDLWSKSGKRGVQKMILCSITKGRIQFNQALLEPLQPPMQ